MNVIVQEKSLVIDKNSTVSDALRAAKLNPENFLVKRKGCLIPHDEPLKDDDSLDLITVISGG